MAFFKIQHEISCKKSICEILNVISTPPLSCGSRVYRKVQITTNDEFTHIFLFPVSQFPSEKNAGIPNIKLVIRHQANANTLKICFELQKGLRVLGIIFLLIIFVFGLAAVISFFVGEIDNFLIACIPWFVGAFGVFIVWVSFQLSTKQLLKDIINKLHKTEGRFEELN